MSEQEGTHSSTKQRRSRKTNTANQQHSKQVPAAYRPSNDDTEAWKGYWVAQGQLWRTEPEIEAERQKYLAVRRAIVPDIVKGIYPFKDIKLTRADVELLLATLENGRGAVDWNDVSQRKRDGLDLRGADLSQEDLRDLPLARMYGALATREWENATEEQRNMAVVCMKGADLRKAQLQRATLRGAQLQGADLRGTQLKGAILYEAQLQGATFRGAQLQGAHLRWAKLQRADLREAQLQGADLCRAQLDGVYLKEATLSDEQYGPALLADVRWGEINLAVVDWMPVKMLGDERQACQTKKVDDYQTAVRANRQLGVVLRDQGLNEVADRFAYRAQLLQRKVFWHQQEFGHWLFSMLLALLSGYGYRIWRILAAYLLTVSVFALAYFVLGIHYPPHMPLDQAFLESITALHGRVFLEQFSPHTPQIWLTALEAIAGLIIEGVFIAMLIQRFFGK